MKIKETTEDINSCKNNDASIKKHIESESRENEQYKYDTASLAAYYVSRFKQDSERLIKDSLHCIVANKELDSLKAVMTTPDFWGFHTIAKIYSHDLQHKKDDKEITVERSVFITKDFEIEQW